MVSLLESQISGDQVNTSVLARFIGLVCTKERKRRSVRLKSRNPNDFIELSSQVINVTSSEIFCENTDTLFSGLTTGLARLNSKKIDMICKCKPHKDLIEIWTPPMKQGRKLKSLKVIDVPIKRELVPFVIATSKFFKPRLKRKDTLWTEKPHIENLNISVRSSSSYILNFSINSFIRLKQSLDAFNSVDFIKSFNDLASFILTSELTKYQKSGYDQENGDWQVTERPSEANFYSQITKNTQNVAFHSERQAQVIPGLRKHLLGFQAETLEWLLRHEGMELSLITQQATHGTEKPSFSIRQIVDRILSDPVDDEILSEALDKYCFGFSRVRLSSNPNEYYWCNMYTANICKREYAISTLRNAFRTCHVAKALLSEEMGLGKTVEMLSLILMNPRKEYAPFATKKLDSFTGDRYLSECKSTLIICPQTIIGQWLSEIQEATQLSVMIYEGISDYEREAQKEGTSVDPVNIAQKLSNYDIILVSYHTVSRELHRAVFRPTTRPKRKCTKRLKFADPSITYDYNGKLLHLSSESRDSDSDSNSGTHDSNIGETDEYERIDYSSPLMLLEFWRVVLDEVQMTASINTNAAKFARIIPRVHSWGVSGTLIKNGLDDLYSLLCFLRYHPIDRFTMSMSDSPWKLITDVPPFYQFSRLFNSICLRHTKKMVSDQIRLPEQSRILLRAPFTSIERDNYDFLFDQFLAQVGLDVNGDPTVDDYDPERSYIIMQKWLRELRQICCHAQLGKQISSKRHATGDSEHENLVIGTISDVLSDLIKRSSMDLSSNERAYYSLKLKKGKIFEFLRLPNRSQALFENLVVDLERKLNAVKKEPETDKSALASKLRPWLELLHQAYFLLASAHFQHYRPMKPLPGDFDQLSAMEIQDVEEERMEIDSALFNSEEKKHFDLENTYYDKADKLLLQILEDPLNKVNICISRMTEKFHSINIYKISSTQLPLSLIKCLKGIFDEKIMVKAIAACRVTDSALNTFQDNWGFNTRTSLFFRRARKCLEDLNIQSHIINIWITKLLALLQQPVANNAGTNKDATGQEYGQTLVNQELANTYLESLQNILEDREHSILSVESINKYKKGTSLKSTVSELTDLNRTVNTELHDKLEKMRRDYMPDGCFNTNYTLKHLWLEITDIEVGMGSPETNSSEELCSLIQATKGMLKAELGLQKNDIKNLRSKLFETLDATFNSKVAYFKALQIKSDTLQKYLPVKQVFSDKTPGQRATEDMNSVDRQLRILQGKIRKGTVRLRYLKTLLPRENLLENAHDKTEEKRICVICRSEILVGILTSCGHQYCRDCLHIWMKNKPICPVCKRTLHRSDLYVFTRTQRKLRGGLIQNSGKGHNSTEQINSGNHKLGDGAVDQEMSKLSNTRLMERDLFKVYKSLDDDVLRSIISVPLVESFGSKVDMIVRQALFLRNQEKGVQILVFSQWPQFLHILGQSLKQNGVRYISSEEIRSRRRETVREEGSSRNNVKTLKFMRESNEIEEFKRNPEITCFLLNAKAQAAGLTLTNASHVFLCEPLVNLSLELQAISRVHRIGQTKPTTVWNFVIEDTVEESIAYMSTKRRIELSKERGPDSSTDAKYVDEDALDVTELSKNSDKLVDKDGEVIANNDLWASFFANRSVQVVDSVVGMHAR